MVVPRYHFTKTQMESFDSIPELMEDINLLWNVGSKQDSGYPWWEAEIIDRNVQAVQWLEGNQCPLQKYGRIRANEVL